MKASPVRGQSAAFNSPARFARFPEAPEASLALGRLPTSESIRVQRHLFKCELCLHQLVEIEVKLVTLEMIGGKRSPVPDKRKPLFIVHDSGDLARPGTSFFAMFGGLYTAYVRGEAYLAAGRGQDAAAEFQKVLDHRGIVFADPIGALAHLQLGRAYTVQGDTAKAKSAYQRFLTLWKGADEDLPVLKHARADYAKL